jgi:hypothetical protein
MGDGLVDDGNEEGRGGGHTCIVEGVEITVLYADLTLHKQERL